jgi:hypothetical protein
VQQSNSQALHTSSSASNQDSNIKSMRAMLASSSQHIALTYMSMRLQRNLHDTLKIAQQ